MLFLHSSKNNRVNTIIGFCAVNNKIISIWDQISGGAPLISANSTIKSNQISNSAVAENTQISEKTSIKSTVFGTNCFVETKTRISDSYIMNNVTIEEGSVIEFVFDTFFKCLKFQCNYRKFHHLRQSFVKRGSILKNCLVGCNYIVEEGTIKEKALLLVKGLLLNKC